jgi:hypothetical protein
MLGESVYRSRILSAVIATPGVRSARIVLFRRTTDGECLGAMEAELEVSRDEYPTLGRLEVNVERV